MINDFSTFCEALSQSGFSMGGGNAKGIFALIPYGWEPQEKIASPVKWHTGDPETDPWEWRMRVLEERSNIAYSKVFFRTSGYITVEWYPCFYAIRRKGQSFEEAYDDGNVSRAAKRIYEIVESNGETALHEIKQLGGFGKEESACFERAVVELQMRMFLTMCGRAQKINRYGEGYGWNSTVFTTVERFWSDRNTDLESLAAAYPPNNAEDRIRKQILRLNPQADEKKITKFIRG